MKDFKILLALLFAIIIILGLSSGILIFLTIFIPLYLQLRTIFLRRNTPETYIEKEFVVPVEKISIRDNLNELIDEENNKLAFIYDDAKDLKKRNDGSFDERSQKGKRYNEEIIEINNKIKEYKEEVSDLDSEIKYIYAEPEILKNKWKNAKVSLIVDSGIFIVYVIILSNIIFITNSFKLNFIVAINEFIKKISWDPGNVFSILQVDTAYFEIFCSLILILIYRKLLMTKYIEIYKKI